jgi:hypothetical protein
VEKICTKLHWFMISSKITYYDKRKLQRNFYISEQLNKDTEIFDTKNINFSLLGGFWCRGLCPRPVSFKYYLI